MSLNNSDKEDSTIYKAVANHEEQYSIWPDYKEIPRGWKYAGKTGSKPECLAYIKEVWTDMRPLSLRKKMDEFANNPPPLSPAPDLNAPRNRSLVDRLCEGDQEIEVGLRPEKSVKLFKAAVDRDYSDARLRRPRAARRDRLSLMGIVGLVHVKSCRR